MTSRDRAANAFLPLPVATFHILLSLADTERHGYAIIQDVARRTDGALTLSPGTLYRSIQRMLVQGLISEVLGKRIADDDPRRRYYRLTALGSRVARAETARLQGLVTMARDAGFLPG